MASLPSASRNGEETADSISIHVFFGFVKAGLIILKIDSGVLIKNACPYGQALTISDISC